MKKNHLIAPLGASLLILILVSCGGKEKKMAKGFVLPEGDVEKGKIAFVAMDCNRCHTVAGEAFPASSEPSEISLHLGGEVYQVKTYGQLVTSIINPQHIISQDYLDTFEKEKREAVSSPMPSMNEKMTVAQMIDIVTFLNSCYIKMDPEYNYDPYGY